MIHIISKSIKPLSDLSVPTRGEFVILEKTPSHEQKNISSWDKGDHKEHLCIDFLSSKKGANELNPGHATMQNASRYPGGDPGASWKGQEFRVFPLFCHLSVCQHAVNSLAVLCIASCGSVPASPPLIHFSVAHY